KEEDLLRTPHTDGLEPRDSRLSRQLPSLVPSVLRFAFSFGRGWFRNGPAHVNDHHQSSNNQHRQRQFLAPCERTQCETDLRIRFSDKLDQEAEEPIKSNQRPEHCA